MSEELRKLIDRARGVQTTAAEREEQRISFAYGNTRTANDSITRDDVVQASEMLRKAKHEQEQCPPR